MKKFASALLSGAAVVMMASSVNAAQIIDNFEGEDFGPANADMMGVAIGGSSVGLNTPDTNIDRLLSAIRTSDQVNFQVGINTPDGSPSGGDGVYSVQGGDNVTGETWISYDLPDSIINDADVNAFSIVLNRSDTFSGQTVEIGAVRSSGALDSEMAFNDAITAAEMAGGDPDITVGEQGTQTFYISFDDAGAGDWVSLFIDTNSASLGNVDISIDSFGTACIDDNGNPVSSTFCNPTDVSEPGTIGLVGLGLVGLAAAARRRKV